jgi:hypothetical protein
LIALSLKVEHDVCMQSEPIRKRFDLLSSILDERTRRIWAAAEAIVLGHGGITATSRVNGK